MNEQNRIKKTTRDVIERNLEGDIEDGYKFVLLLSKQDMDDLLTALYDCELRTIGGSGERMLFLSRCEKIAATLKQLKKEAV